MTGPVLLTIPAAAERCGIAPRTMHDWIAGGDVETIEINGRKRIPIRWINQFTEAPR